MKSNKESIEQMWKAAAKLGITRPDEVPDDESPYAQARRLRSEAVANTSRGGSTVKYRHAKYVDQQVRARS